MKFSALVLSGAALASAAAVAPRNQPDACPAVKKTVKLSWVETKVFKKIQTWTKEDVKKCIDNSKYDPKQVYPHLNGTKSSYPTAKPTTTKGPYPTGTWYGNGTNTYTPLPTGGASTTTKGSDSSSTTTTSSVPSSTPSSDGTCRNPSVRVEWRNMGDDQRDAYVRAVKCMMDKDSADTSRFPGSRSRYEDFASLHQQLASYIHSVGAFLPYHRYMVHVWEDVIRSECGYSGPMPWWDETMDAGNFASAPLFTNRWFGSLSNGGDGRGHCVDDAYWGSFEANIGPGWDINAPHCLSRSVDEGWSGNTAGWAISDCNGAQNYDDFRQCNERTYHAAGHYGVGSVMSDGVASPEDPVFYLHHGYVDQAYASWQSGAEHRLFEIGGQSPSGTTTPDDVLTSFGIRPDVKISDVLDTQGGYLCYTYDK